MSAYEHLPPVDHGRVMVMDFFKAMELAAMADEMARLRRKK